MLHFWPVGGTSSWLCSNCPLRRLFIAVLIQYLRSLDYSCVESEHFIWDVFPDIVVQKTVHLPRFWYIGATVSSKSTVSHDKSEKATVNLVLLVRISGLIEPPSLHKPPDPALCSETERQKARIVEAFEPQ